MEAQREMIKLLGDKISSLETIPQDLIMRHRMSECNRIKKSYNLERFIDFDLVTSIHLQEFPAAYNEYKVPLLVVTGPTNWIEWMLFKTPDAIRYLNQSMHNVISEDEFVAYSRFGTKDGMRFVNSPNFCNVNDTYKKIETDIVNVQEDMPTANAIMGLLNKMMDRDFKNEDIVVAMTLISTVMYRQDKSI